MACICHFQSTKSSDNLINLTAVTLKTLESSVLQWLELDKEPERSICCSGKEIKADSLIHKSCYTRLTSKSKLQQAKHNYEKVSHWNTFGGG